MERGVAYVCIVQNEGYSGSNKKSLLYLVFDASTVCMWSEILHSTTLQYNPRWRVVLAVSAACVLYCIVLYVFRPRRLFVILSSSLS